MVVFASGAVGILLGLFAGYFGKAVDSVIMRLMDILLAFPAILLAIAIVAVRGPSLENTMIAVGVVSVPGYARVVRSIVLSVRERDYIDAARMIGVSHGRIMFVHILPNSLSPIIVQMTLGVGSAILFAAALGFLGLGVQPPIPEWGAMISDAILFSCASRPTRLLPRHGDHAHRARFQPARSTACAMCSTRNCASRA